MYMYMYSACTCRPHVSKVLIRFMWHVQFGKRWKWKNCFLCAACTLYMNRAPQLDSTPQPHPPLGTAATPVSGTNQAHKHRRRHILSRHRNTGARRNKASTKTSRFSFGQQKFFNFRFTPKLVPAEQEEGVAATDSTKQPLPTQQFVYRGCGTESTESDGHSYKSKLLDPSLEPQHTPTTTDGGSSQQSLQDSGAGAFQSCAVRADGLHTLARQENEALNNHQNNKPSVSTDRSGVNAASNAMPHVGGAQIKSLGHIGPLVDACTISHVPNERPTKKIKCVMNWGDDESDKPEPSLKIRASKSDFSIDSASKHLKSGDQSPFKFVTPRGIPPSKSHPIFPFSQPRPHLQGVRFPFLDAQNDHIEKASFPFTPHSRGRSNNQFSYPQNDPIQKASFPFTPYPSQKPSKTPSPDNLYCYLFANPTPVNLRPDDRTHAVKNDRESMAGEASIIQNLNKAFINDSQDGEDTFPLEGGSVHVATITHETTPPVGDEHAHKTNTGSKAALLRRLSNVHGKATPTPLDDAFLQTPFLLSTNSPNLLEKITSEIALRHKFSLTDDSSHSLVVSKTQSSAGSESSTQQKSDSGLWSSVCSHEDKGGSAIKEQALFKMPLSKKECVTDLDKRVQVGGDSHTSQSAAEMEMAKNAVLRVNDSYKKAVHENRTGSLLSRQPQVEDMKVMDTSITSSNDLIVGARVKKEGSISMEGDGCFNDLLPQQLKFDSSHDSSTLSGEVTHQLQSASAVNNSLPAKAGLPQLKGQAKSPSITKTRSTRSRQLVTPKSSARRRMAYSATLGLSEQLLVTRNPARTRKSMKQPNATSSNNVDPMSTTSCQTHHKPSTTAAALSASLGITEMSLGGLGQGPPVGSRRVRRLKKLEKEEEDGLQEDGGSKSLRGPCWDSNESSSTKMNSTNTSTTSNTTNTSAVCSNVNHHQIEGDSMSKEATLQHKVEGSARNTSPTPALLRILDVNGVPTQSHLHQDKRSSDKSSEHHPHPHHQRRRMSKSKSTTHLNNYCRDNKDSALKPPLNKVYSSDEPVNHKFKAVGGTVQCECSLVTRPPSPRLPFGLRSPWFRSSNKEDPVPHGQGIRATQGGKISK